MKTISILILILSVCLLVDAVVRKDWGWATLNLCNGCLASHLLLKL